MKSLAVMLVALLAAITMVWAEEAAPAPTEPLIKMSAGSAKIIGEPMVKEFPAMKAASAIVKAADYAPEGGYTMDEAGVQKAYGSMMDDGFKKLMGWAHETGTFPSGPAFGMFFEDPSMTDPAKLTAKVGFPVGEGAKSTDAVLIEEIPAMTAVRLQYAGPYENGNNAWTTAMEWMTTNGYDWGGAPMEIYLKGPMDVKDANEYLTEIRIPVKKAEPQAEVKE